MKEITIEEAMNRICDENPMKVVLSKRSNGSQSEYEKIIMVSKKEGYQIEQYTKKQVFHKNVTLSEGKSLLVETLRRDFMQLNAWDGAYEHMILISKKGKVTYKKKEISGSTTPKISINHNRKKQYLLEEGMVIPPLVDMGIFTKEYKVVRSMYDKFRQINRFVELVHDEVKDRGDQPLHIIDFGCGKSYLTFILYYYFTQVAHIPVTMTGLDLKEDVIKKCNETAKKYGYDGLHFELGDINGYESDTKVDMVITLHACDVATDYALYNAICWDADMIFSVPCCQHEWNQQMQTEQLAFLTRYGIVQERVSALMTDAIRGELLEACGYKTQLLEFVELSHTPKNILIRAVKKRGRADTKKKRMEEVEAAIATFHTKPKLYELLEDR